MPPELRPVLRALLRDKRTSLPTHSATLWALTSRGLVEPVSEAGGRTDVRLTARGRVMSRLIAQGEP